MAGKPKDQQLQGGTVYLLHFNPPYRARTGQKRATVGHYLGYSKLPLAEHLAALRAGTRRSGLIAAVVRAGCQLEVADTWECPTDELLGQTVSQLRRINRRKAMCSICHPGNRVGMGRWPEAEQPVDEEDALEDGPEG